MADIFQEVDEEVRRDKLLDQAKKYGPWIVAAMIVVVLAIAAVSAWRYYQSSQRLAASNEFVAAMDLAAKGEREKAVALFAKLGGSAPEPYATMARLREGTLKAEGGDKVAAVAIFDEIAVKGGDADLRALAKILAAAQTLEGQGPDAAIGRLETLAGSDGPWRNLAREYLALAQVQKGELAKARQMLEALVNDTQISNGQRARARELLAALPGGDPAAKTQ